MPRFADVEQLTHDGLDAALTARVVTDVPGNLAEAVQPDGLVRAVCGPGSDDYLNDSVVVDIESFTAKSVGRAAAWALAEQARDAMHALAGTSVNGRLIDTVTTAARPQRLDYGNPAVERIVASYRLTHRAR